MSTSKIKRFASFRHRRENVHGERADKCEADARKNGRDRRRSLSAGGGREPDQDVVDGAPRVKDIVRALQKWKVMDARPAKLERNGERAAMDKRKSASIGNVTVFEGYRQRKMEDNMFLSDGNLANAFMQELKKTLASRQVVEAPEDEKPEEVTLRRPSQLARRPDSSRSKTCFLYPGPSVINRNVVIKQGPIERIKVGGSRRLPRHWSRQKYACLTSDGRMCMSEDAAAAVDAATRPHVALGSTPVDTILVAGAKVSRGTHHSSKKNVIEIVETEGRLSLLQSDDVATIDSWFEVLMKTSGRGGSLPRSKSFVRPGSPDRNPRTPVQDTTVRSALGRFLGGGRRPTRESLETRGIYRDEPVFGNRLEVLCPRKGSTLEPPSFVQEIIQMLSKPPHVHQIGLYRTSGNLSHIQRLRVHVDQQDEKAFAEEQDTDVLAGALKLFFRELREPVLPYSAYVRLLDTIDKQTDTKHVKNLLRSSLHPAHLITLAALCKHLAHVVSFEKQNQMSATSMAIVWGPSLTWPEDANQDAMLQCTRVNRVIEYLIVNERELFQ